MNIQVQQKAGEAPFKLKYGNYIGGKWVEPKSGRYMDNLSPVTGHKICEVPRSDAADIEFALDAAHKARDKWGKTSITERSNILLKIAQRIEDNLDLIARAETWDNGKPLRETTNADIPLAIDHFRYFAGCIRTRHFADLVAGHRREIVHVAAGFRLHPLAANVIAVFQLEGRFARFLLNLNIHDFILPDENDPERTA